MSIDLKVMRPDKLAGLLNSTCLGEVTSETRVRRNIVRAGLRVGDSTRVNVLGYAAWLVAAWHARRGPGDGGLAGYDALRASSAARNRRLSAAGRDIAPIPDAANPDRRAACEKDFRRFCETYFPAAFTLAWSGDHLKVISKIEAAVLRGGQFLGQVAHTAPGALVHRQAADILALEDDAAGVSRNHTDGHPEGRGLAGAVLAQEADDLRLVDGERNIVDNLTAAVVLLKPGPIEEFHAAAPYLWAEAPTRGAGPDS